MACAKHSKAKSNPIGAETKGVVTYRVHIPLLKMTISSDKLEAFVTSVRKLQAMHPNLKMYFFTIGQVS
jgi:hypothetical protein